MISGTVEVAVACASPLCEVLCKAVAEVDVAEYWRAAQVLTAMSGVDPACVGAECNQPRGRCNMWDVWKSGDSALGVALAKEPALLSIEDAITACCALAPVTVQWSTSTGADAVLQATGIDAMEFFGMMMPANFMLNVATPSDDRNLVLCPLVLDLLRAPDKKLPDFVLGGALYALQAGVIGRPIVAAKLLDHDIVTVYTGILREASPSEQVATAGYSRHSHGYVLLAMCVTHGRRGLDLSE